MNPQRVLIDAGPLVAIFSRQDQRHSECVEAARRLPATLATCWPVITEAAYLIRAWPRGVQALLSRIELRTLDILALDSNDAASIRGILSRYADQDFDFADACLMHLAEREGITQVFSLDRRHFGVFRQSSGHPLEVFP